MSDDNRVIVHQDLLHQESHNALTLRNLLSISHTFFDLLVRRIGKIMYPKRNVRPRLRERVELYEGRRKLLGSSPNGEVQASAQEVQA